MESVRSATSCAVPSWSTAWWTHAPAAKEIDSLCANCSLASAHPAEIALGGFSASSSRHEAADQGVAAGQCARTARAARPRQHRQPSRPAHRPAAACAPRTHAQFPRKHRSHAASVLIAGRSLVAADLLGRHHAWNRRAEGEGCRCALTPGPDHIGLIRTRSQYTTWRVWTCIHRSSACVMESTWSSWAPLGNAAHSSTKSPTQGACWGGGR
jgi:hypothetical protein